MHFGGFFLTAFTYVKIELNVGGSFQCVATFGSFIIAKTSIPMLHRPNLEVIGKPFLSTLLSVSGIHR